MTKRLYRSKDNHYIGGVCGGIAEYFNIDPTLVRLGLLVFALMGGSGVLAYIIAWCVIPEHPGYIDGDAHDVPPHHGHDDSGNGPRP